MTLDDVRSRGDIGGLIGFFSGSGSNTDSIRFVEGQLALEALVKIGAPAVPRLIDALINFRDDDTCWRSGQALRHIGAGSVPVAAIVDGLASSVSSVRESCAWVLEGLGPEITDPHLRSRVANSLIGCLSDVSAAVRRAASKAMAGVAGEEERDQLLAIMDQADPEVRKGISAALNRIGADPQWVLLLNGLIDVNIMVRIDTAEKLGSVGSGMSDTSQRQRIVKALIHSLREDGQFGVRIAAAAALGAIGDASAIPALQEAAERDGNWRVEKSASAAMRRIQDKE